MRTRLLLGLLAATLGAACGDNTDSDPFTKLPLEGAAADVRAPGMHAPVYVARDKYGVAHIRAETVGDAGFAQGYLMAHDRLPQMDILRRFGSGTLAELFGAADASVLDTDFEMRVHRMRPLAQQAWDTLKASTDPTDQRVVLLLQRFADGVNAYAADLQAAKWTLDPEVQASFDPTRFAAWSPVDSLVLGRFQAFALSWSTPFELDATELYQDILATYHGAPSSDAPKYARADIAKDLLTFAPVGTAPTIDGFPNVGTDTGTRSDGGRPGRSPKNPAAKVGAPAPAAAGVQRPWVPAETLADARTFFRKGVFTGANGALGPHAFMRPFAGSNNWAVSPALANGQALLATDQHLQLPNPSIFYPTHLEIADEHMDVLGITFPGIPGVILGTNGKVAWSATVSEHDVNDVYLETISPCSGGTGSCVAFQGSQVPIQTFEEQFDVGAFGTITEHHTATYEVVPHHGPIIPKVVNHAVVPRTATSALSVKYTGYQPTFEIRALWNLAHASTVDEAFAALSDFSYGSQNWTMIDVNKDIAWTTNAIVPNRDPRAYTWNATTNPTGLAPFFVLPGDGAAEWQGRMDSRYVPHAIDPAQGYLATANADPVGATFDNDPLNQPVVDGRPLYAGITYAAGVREERITTLIKAGGTALTVADMAKIQHDTQSNVGDKLHAAIGDALAQLDAATPAQADVATYKAGLTADDSRRLATAKTLLAAWTGATPTALDPGATAQDKQDSAATALFNTWMHYFIEAALADEFDAMSFDVWRLDDNQLVRIIYAMLVDGHTFVASATTHQPILCDRLNTLGPDDSCTKIILMAMVSAMTHLESADGYGTLDTTQWAWGKLHHLKITPLFPNPQLNLPKPGETPYNGFPKAGDNFVVNRSDMGWGDLDFSQYADGPAQRFLATTATGEDGGQTIAVQWALPGGVIYDSRSPHYRDLLDQYYLPMAHFDAPYTLKQIVEAGESRWTFR